jgi:hypothetical protein
MKDYVYRNSVVGITTYGKDVQRNLSVAKGVLTCTGQTGLWT